jgi:hypothetical protein
VLHRQLDRLEAIGEQVNNTKTELSQRVANKKQRVKEDFSSAMEGSKDMLVSQVDNVDKFLMVIACQLSHFSYFLKGHMLIAAPINVALDVTEAVVTKVLGSTDQPSATPTESAPVGPVMRAAHLTQKIQSEVTPSFLFNINNLDLLQDPRSQAENHGEVKQFAILRRSHPIRNQ